MADFCLLTARRSAESGSLMRDIDMFICEVNAPRQKIVVEEYFENLGLYQIPCGRNHIDVYIPDEQRLIPHTTGIKMLLDLLHRSRFQFSGMGLGFIRRILDEAISHTKSRLQANFTVCSAFCLKSGEIAGFGNDLTSRGLEANVIKSVTSDIMYESARSLLQLIGAKGYKLNHFAGRSVVDSRPFQIFEGSNDILYHQIAVSVLKLMKTVKEKSLYQFLKGFTARAADRIHEMVNFELDIGQMKYTIIGLLILFVVSSCHQPVDHRKQISLNGVWEIAKTEVFAGLPTQFASKVTVPGLVDMSNPKIDQQDTAYNNSIYWYKRTFTVKDLNADVIQLKINKANYHTWVYVNRKLVGENVYNFTPSVFNVKPFLNEDNKENELIIAVGCRNNLPDTVTHGGDFEKTKYIPGIYDNVKLTLSGYPFISNFQMVPDIKNEQLRVVAEIQTNSAVRKTGVSYIVREAVSKKMIAQGSVQHTNKGKAAIRKIDFMVKMNGCQLWTPENPFLYDLELSTSGDNTSTRFGMRTFAASRDSGIFLLNDKPYYMRGTNVCIFRFFEDTDRDAIESHPYLFIDFMTRKPGKEGYLKEFFQEVRIPRNDPNDYSPSPDGKAYANPIILNEYGWLWLNCNGTTTTLTDKVYANVFPEADTPEKRGPCRPQSSERYPPQPSLKQGGDGVGILKSRNSCFS